MHFGMGKRIQPEQVSNNQEAKGGVASERGADAQARTAKTPAVSILSKDFKYVASAKTDLSKLFKRIKREQEAAKQESKVQPIRRQA